ncbi:MAG: complex I NDUFA9 subunit family protein [Gammaproteobacteria bacterium]
MARVGESRRLDDRFANQAWWRNGHHLAPLIMRTLDITVLGGTGFVGSALVARLATAGHRLRLPSRNPHAARHLAVLPNVERIRADVHDPEALRKVVAGSEVVINLVGILNEKGRSGRGFNLAHAELTRKTIAACIETGVSRYLHMSALGANDGGPSHYLRSKGIAERHVRAAPASLDWTIFRPSVIFGRGDSLLNRFAGLLHLSGGFIPLARAEAKFSPVWIDDVVSSFESALLGGATSRQSYDLCGPEVITLADLVRYTGSLAGTGAHVIALPDVIGRLQARLMDFVPGKPFSTDNFLSLTVDNVCQDNGFARLGITPTPLRSIAPTYIRPSR